MVEWCLHFTATLFPRLSLQCNLTIVKVNSFTIVKLHSQSSNLNDYRENERSNGFITSSFVYYLSLFLKKIKRSCHMIFRVPVWTPPLNHHDTYLFRTGMNGPKEENS